MLPARDSFIFKFSKNAETFVYNLQFDVHQAILFRNSEEVCPRSSRCANSIPFLPSIDQLNSSRNGGTTPVTAAGAAISGETVVKLTV
ncbi:unnamed protein product [Linum trigynum]|uniref:Uncharacterized protein n=1 Tax=Linum trigynum TaxID=586398 RepID=A0AAV2FS85_9ROSI